MAGAGNPFDQFDGSSGSTGGGNPFDTFDPPKTSAPKANTGGFWKNVGAGLEEFPGAALSALSGNSTASMVSGPNDEKTSLPAEEQPDIAASTSHAIGKVTGLDPAKVTQNTFGDKVGRMMGNMAPMLLAPEAEAPMVADDLGAVGSQVVKRFANSPVASTARRVATGTGAAVGATAAPEFVPDDDPVLKQAVGVLGGIAGGAATEAPALLRGMAGAAKTFAKPLTTAGQEQLAGDTIRNAATNPEMVADNLSSAQPELVTGSKPTTFQQTGDMGLGGLERSVAAKNPVEFNQRRADQNQARVSALGEVQPTLGINGETGGNPADVGTFLNSQFGKFDQQTQQHIDDLTTQAQQQTEALGGSGNPEDHGAAIRASLQDAENAARAKERSLWQSVDPDRNLVMNATPVADASKEIAGGMSSSAKPMEGEEASIFDVAQNYDHQTPLADMADLRSRTSAAMRQELTTNGRTPAYARLTRLRGAIQNNLSDAATNQASQDAVDISNGTITPSQSLAGRIQSWADDFYQNRAAQTGNGPEEGLGPVSGGQQAGHAGDNGTGIPASGGSGSPAGDQGVPPQPFDQAAADRLGEATQATKDRAGTFGSGPAGQVLAKAGTQDAYKLPEARVPEKYFHAGPTSFQDIQGLRQTVGDEAALPILQDYAASSLRKSAENADGTLNPTKVAAWQTKYGQALRAFPELNARFSTAADASEAIAQSAADRASAIKDRNATALGKVMNAPDGDTITKTVGSLFGQKNSVQSMQELAQAASRSPEAYQGLRQAVADHMTQNFISNTEGGTSGIGLIKSDAFQTFVKKNRGALGQVFNPEEMGTLDAIAADLNRANRSITAAKLPGGSNTAQDMHSIISNDPNSTVLDHAISEAGAASAGAMVGHLPGALLGGMGAKVANAIRASGLRKVDDLVTQAMLNPDLARALLRKAPSSADSGQSVALASRLRRIALAAAATRLGPLVQQPSSSYARGGRTKR